MANILGVFTAPSTRIALLCGMREKDKGDLVDPDCVWRGIGFGCYRHKTQGQPEASNGSLNKKH